MTPVPVSRNIRRFSAAWPMKQRTIARPLSQKNAPNSTSVTALPRARSSTSSGRAVRQDAPIAVFIHGGYWRALQPSAFSQVAKGLNAHGVTVALIGYDLCPQVSISDIVDEVRRACVFLWKRFGKPLLVHGHSAGGHLAAVMIATEWQKLGAPEDLVPAAMGISGLFDLGP